MPQTKSVILAPDDIRKGMYVSILRWKERIQSSIAAFDGDEWKQPPSVKNMHLVGHVLRVADFNYPFVLVQLMLFGEWREWFTLDVQAFDMIRVTRSFANTAQRIQREAIERPPADESDYPESETTSDGTIVRARAFGTAVDPN